MKSQPKLSLNRCVFSCCRKEVKDETVRMAGGRLFHARDAATGKARSPRPNWSEIDKSAAIDQYFGFQKIRDNTTDYTYKCKLIF